MEDKRKRLTRVKTSEKNLFRQGDTYVYRKGDFERSLGSHASEKIAIAYKRVFEAKLNRVGSEAFKFRASDVWPDYIKQRESEMNGTIKGRKQISPRTFSEMLTIWDLHLEPFFGTKRLAEIDTILWTKYVQAATISDLTNHRKVLGTFIRWCNKNGYMQTLPLLEVPKVIRRVRPILKPAQIETIIHESTGPLLVFVGLYLFMAMRWSEIIRLKWASVNFDAGHIVIDGATSRTRKTRAIPANKFCLHILTRQLMDQREQGIDSPWVFPKAGKPDEHRSMTTIGLSWKRMLVRAGLRNIKPHDLRATFEYYANKNTSFTDTQREKMAGASIEVQRKHYVSFEAEDMRGLEDVVPMNAEFLQGKLSSQIQLNSDTGKTRVRKNLTDKKPKSSSFGKRKSHD